MIAQLCATDNRRFLSTVGAGNAHLVSGPEKIA